MKYIYIDDDPNANNKIQGFENSNLAITTEQYRNSWEEQMRYIIEIEKSIDGMILDLKLGNSLVRDNKRASFRGTSLAQEIRTRQKEGVLDNFPIVLFYDNDEVCLTMEKSGMDLFDICIDKSSIESFAFYTSQLISLSEGYKQLTINNKVEDVFNTDVTLLDSRFVFEFEGIRGSSVHDQTRFLITEFFEKQGLLIDESVLAARLGIDLFSSEDWDIVKQQLECAKYKGVFSYGWHRWWANLVEKWWKEMVTDEMQLRTTAASMRVQSIKERYGLSNIVPATRIDKAKSDEFWTVCKGYRKPLDTIDGLLISGQDNLYSWQELEYVSIDAALKKKGINKWHSLADVEKEHFDVLKLIYEPKNRKKTGN